jgi:hypothetical protein
MNLLLGFGLFIFLVIIGAGVYYLGVANGYKKAQGSGSGGEDKKPVDKTGDSEL